MRGAKTRISYHHPRPSPDLIWIHRGLIAVVDPRPRHRQLCPRSTRSHASPCARRPLHRSARRRPCRILIVERSPLAILVVLHPRRPRQQQCVYECVLICRFYLCMCVLGLMAREQGNGAAMEYSSRGLRAYLVHAFTLPHARTMPSCLPAHGAEQRFLRLGARARRTKVPICNMPGSVCSWYSNRSSVEDNNQDPSNLEYVSSIVSTKLLGHVSPRTSPLGPQSCRHPP